MDGPEIVKRKHPLTLVAGILCGLLFVLVCASVALLLAPYEPYLLLIFLVAIPFVAVAGIILAIVSKRERVKKVWIPFLVIDIVLGIASFAMYPIAGAKLLMGGIATSAVDRAKENATIEYVKSIFPEEGIRLHTHATDPSEFYYFDDDGSIASAFLETEFTLSCQSACMAYSETRFELQNNVTVTFSSDYQGIVIHAIYGTFWGYGEAYASYSMALDRGMALHNKIDAKVEEQKNAYEEKEAEVEAATNLPVALASMSEGDAMLRMTLVDEDSDQGFVSVQDSNKELFAALQGINPASMAPWDGSDVTYSPNFQYNSNNDSPYRLRYYATERCLCIDVKYVDPYHRYRSTVVAYTLDEATGNNLMEVARSIAKEASGAASSNSTTTSTFES